MFIIFRIEFITRDSNGQMISHLFSTLKYINVTIMEKIKCSVSYNFLHNYGVGNKIFASSLDEL